MGLGLLCSLQNPLSLVEILACSGANDGGRGKFLAETLTLPGLDTGFFNDRTPSGQILCPHGSKNIKNSLFTCSSTGVERNVKSSHQHRQPKFQKLHGLVCLMILNLRFHLTLPSVYGRRKLGTQSKM